MLEASEFLHVQNNTHSQAKVVEKNLKDEGCFKETQLTHPPFFSWQSLKASIF